MADGHGSICWEEVLDRELTELEALQGGLPGLRTDRGPVPEPGAPSASDSRSARADRPVGVDEFRREVFEAIRHGRALSVDVCDDTGALLLAAGSQITREFLEFLRERGITGIQLRSPRLGDSAEDRPDPRGDAGADGLQTPRSRELDERLAGELQRPIVFHSVRAWRRPRLSVDDLKNEAIRGVKRHEATSAAVAGLCEALEAGRRVSAPELRRSVAQFVDMAAIDFDLLPLIVALQKSGDEYLFDHCVNVAMLSMAIASQLGLDRETIMEIGLGGILQDIGMLRVPPSIRLSDRAPTDDDWREIRRHPLHTLDMLADIRGIPQTIKFIAYQVHERLDGTGYPRRRSGRQLHQYAQIVSLADVFAAMTRDRPYRPALLPYIATKTILSDGAADKFDRDLVRTFLDTVSLFPIGSRVELSGGSSARVLRANPGLHTRPVVEELAVDGSPSGHIIDLSGEDAPRVVKAS